MGTEIELGIISEDFPCVFYLRNGNLVWMHSTAGNIHTALPKNIKFVSAKSQLKLTSFQFSNSTRILLGLSETQIQILALNSDNELLSYAPFSPICQYFSCENSVLFSKKYSNVFYYLDNISELSTETVRFGTDASNDYIIKRCMIDNKEINESKLVLVSFSSTLVSLDVNSLDFFVFLTKDSKAHLLKGNKGTSKIIQTLTEPKQVRWHSTGEFFLVMTTGPEIYAFDWNLHPLSLMSPYGDSCIDLSLDFLYKAPCSLISKKSVFFIEARNNVAVLQFPVGKSIIDLHLASDNLKFAIESLDLIQDKASFTTGFFKCWKYIGEHPSVPHIQNLETVWTKYTHSRLKEPFASKLILRLGYVLLRLKAFEPAFLLARKLRNIRLLSDLSFYADFYSFKGIAMLAKHERESIDEEYISPKEELENIIKFTGKTMTPSDYSILLNDLEEVMSVSSLAEAQSKGGYIEEKNFWEINLEEYARGLELEGQGKYEEALEIYSSNSLSQEVNRVRLIMEYSNKPLSNYESNVNMEEFS